MENLKELLESAKAEVKNLEDKKNNITEMTKRIEEKTKELNQLESKKQKCIEDTLKEKKKELEDAYNNMFVEITRRLNDAKDKKKKEIIKNKEELAEKETKEAKAKVLELKNKLKSLLKENKKPQFVNSKFYFSLFQVENFQSVLIAIVVFVFLLVGIPALIIYFKGAGLSIWTKILIIAINTFLWGMLWMLISHFTQIDTNVLNEIKSIRKEIRSNKKEIKKTINKVMKDNDESKFDYTEIDRVIDEANVDLNNVKEKYKKDIEIFNTKVHDEVVNKIHEESKNEIETLKDFINKEKVSLELLTEEKNKLENNIFTKYSEAIGKDNLTSENINKLIEVINSNDNDKLLLDKAKDIIKNNK